MKLIPLLLLLGASSFWKEGFLVAGDAEIPTQTFFIPLPEKDLFDNTFKSINNAASGAVNSIIAIAISTTNTIIWFDHQEDGYEPICRIGAPMRNTTQIWGDGNCANGFAPNTTCTSPSHDILRAGQSIVIQNDVLVASGTRNNITYNGGDKIMATYPIAITRGAYPDSPGSLMAGGVEVLDTAEWGTFYVVPIGQNVSSDTAAFEHTAVYVMAQQNNTVVTFSDGTTRTLQTGQSHTKIVLLRGLTITSSFPVQVDLLAGDKGSNYELRWYALLPREAWTNRYLSPVGDTTGKTKIFLYNPSSSTLTVNVAHSDETKNGSRLFPSNYTVTVSGLSSSFTNDIPTGTGAQLDAESPFIALSLTDTGGGGQIYDWGFPVLPTNKLSEKVLIGWGYGCTDKNCNGRGPRSVVFVSPWQDADIYVDLNNDGIPEAEKTVLDVKRLSSVIVQNGPDLSGAIIWAVEPGMPFDSFKTVPIAAAWGQFADYSFSNDDFGLDLGTLVPPFIGVRVDEVVTLTEDIDGDGQISPGDVVQYTIQVQNAGERSYGPCDYMIKNPGLPANLPQQTYIFPSCIFINGDQTQSCTDGLLNGGNGLCSPVSLPKRGGVHLYKFNAIIGPASSITEGGISNQGNLTQGTLGPVLPFSATEAIHFRPSITIEKTVHRGVLTSCSNGNETISGRQGDNVTYCFQVTNTGNSYLNNVVVTDPDNGMQPITTIPFMAPGDVHFVSFQTRMPALPIKTNATVTAEPRLVNKNVIPTHEGGPVTDSDDAGVSPIPFVPAIDVKKYAGPPGSTCNIPRMQDSMYVSADTQFEYCYAVRTLGDECLVNINLTDNSVGGIGRRSISRLCPTDTPFFFSGPLSRTTVDIPLTDAIVAGIGEISRTNVTDTDPAGVDVPTFIPKLSIKKYAGPQGSNCKISSMKDTTYPAPNTKFQYCYVLKNIGNECVSNITISDSAVGGIGTQSVALLCPTDSALNISGPLASTLIDIASTNAVATGKGVYSGSTVSAKDPAAVDVPAFAPKLKLKKYAGPVGSSCGVSAMQDDNFVTTDTKFEYCYIISNPSNECVTNITLSDNAVGGIVSQQIGSLCPSEVPKTIVGPPSMTEGKVPSLDGTVQGLGEYTKIAVTSSDPAAVEYVKPTVPGIKIDKTVHLGEIGTCVTGQELEYGFAGTVISYCYEVTNTGDVDLSVLLTDAPVHTSETFPLAVGQSTFIKKVSTIAADLTSPGVAFGTPTSGVAVTASDPASVKLVAQNTRCE